MNAEFSRLASNTLRIFLAAALIAIGLVADTAFAEDCPYWSWPFPVPRQEYAMAFDPVRGVTVVFGGASNGYPIGDTWEWDGAVWRLRPVLGPPARRRASMVYDTVRHVCVLFGGDSYPDGSSPGAQFNDTWEWDGETWTQRSSSGPIPRSAASMAFDSSRGVAVLFAGYKWPRTAPNVLSDTWEWDGVSWTQRTVPGPTPRYDAAMTFDSHRAVTVLIGGNLFDPDFVDTWEWNGSAWTRVSIVGPAARYGASLDFDSSRNVSVLFGGYASGTLPAQTWEWNGVAWAPIAVTGPIGRFRHRAVFDSVRNKTVLFGGNDRLRENDETWEYDGAVWTLKHGPSPQLFSGGNRSMTYDSQRAAVVIAGDYSVFGTWDLMSDGWKLRATTGNPSVRSDQAVAFDSWRNQIVLFGGSDNHGSLGDTWLCTGDTWALAATTGPAPRFVHSMAFDKARGVTVLYGGVIGTNGHSTETWEWNGAAWTLVAPAGPLASTGVAMAYDEDRAVTVLFGGADAANQIRGETWEWNGVAWSMRAAGGPSPRTDAAMDYDAARHAVVLFGGHGPNALGDVWQWDGSTWTMLAPGSDAGPGGGEPMVYDPIRQEHVVFENVNWTRIFKSADFHLVSGPLPQHVADDAIAEFSIDADGPPPLQYQWFHEGLPVIDDSRISGSHVRNLVIHNVMFLDAGAYVCHIASVCGTIQSPPAELTIAINCTADISGDGVVDSFDLSLLLGRWGELAPDLNADRIVNSSDLALLLALWGPCQ